MQLALAACQICLQTDMFDLLANNALLVVAMMISIWVISIPIRNVSIIDIFWGLGFVLVAWSTFGRTEGDAPSRWMLPLMTTIWGCRLAVYLAWRNLGEPEDHRYAAMREHWQGKFWWLSLFTVFLLQAVILWLVSLPLQMGISQAEPEWSAFHVVGLLLWAVGLFFESVGDWQLARFKSNPENQGQVLDRGLWRYTRHPNYFGDFCVWWGLYCVSIAHGVAIWTVISPLVMSIFLMKFSGVGLLEKSLNQSKPKYQDYVQRTNAFFPWFPKTS